MRKRINVCFYGPYKYEQIINQGLPQNIEQCGIYLNCIKNEEIYYVYYIGQSVNLENRQNQHNRNYILGKNSLFTIVKDNEKLVGLDMIYIPDYDNFNKPEIQKEVINNIDSTFLFLGNIDNDESVSITDIEGAFQIHFWRKTETRKFLLTKIQSYNLKNCDIFIKFWPKDKSEKIKICGLDSQIIITP